MILMCSLVLGVHSIFQPYAKKRVNVIETIYLYILCVMAVMQVLEQKNIANIVCTVLLITTTVHALVLTVYKAVGFFERRFRRRGVKKRAHSRGYGAMGETPIERSFGAEQRQRKSIFEIIFSRSDDSEDTFGK